MSSWAEWGAYLSDATELHVNSPPISNLFEDMSQQFDKNPVRSLTDDKVYYYCKVYLACYGLLFNVCVLLRPMCQFQTMKLEAMNNRMIFHNQKKRCYFGHFMPEAIHKLPGGMNYTLCLGKMSAN